MALVILHLGSNKGNRQDYIELALNAVEKEIGTIIKKSSIIETKAWGNEDQNSFLNSAIIVESDQSPFQILKKIHDIESTIGRNRIEKWGPREIDIDIILYDDLIIRSSLLNLPHPHFAQRKFVLDPLMEIVPDIMDPSSNRTIAQIHGEFMGQPKE